MTPKWWPKAYATAGCCLGLLAGLVGATLLYAHLDPAGWRAAAENGLLGAITTFALTFLGILATVAFVVLQLGREERDVARQRRRQRRRVLRLLRHETDRAIAETAPALFWFNNLSTDADRARGFTSQTFSGNVRRLMRTCARTLPDFEWLSFGAGEIEAIEITLASRHARLQSLLAAIAHSRWLQPNATIGMGMQFLDLKRRYVRFLLAQSEELESAYNQTSSAEESDFRELRLFLENTHGVPIGTGFLTVIPLENREEDD